MKDNEQILILFMRCSNVFAFSKACFTIFFLRFFSSISDAFLVISINFKEIKKKQSKLRKSRVGYAGRNHFFEHMIF